MPPWQGARSAPYQNTPTVDNRAIHTRSAHRLRITVLTSTTGSVLFPPHIAIHLPCITGITMTDSTITAPLPTYSNLRIGHLRQDLASGIPLGSPPDVLLHALSLLRNPTHTSIPHSAKPFVTYVEEAKITDVSINQLRYESTTLLVVADHSSIVASLSKSIGALPQTSHKLSHQYCVPLDHYNH